MMLGKVDEESVSFFAGPCCFIPYRTPPASLPADVSLALCLECPSWIYAYCVVSMMRAGSAYLSLLSFEHFRHPVISPVALCPLLGTNNFLGMDAKKINNRNFFSSRSSSSSSKTERLGCGARTAVGRGGEESATTAQAGERQRLETCRVPVGAMVPKTELNPGHDDTASTGSSAYDQQQQHLGGSEGRRIQRAAAAKAVDRGKRVAEMILGCNEDGEHGNEE
ncbi:unnamed protein product, partial [Ectocarpus sp. 12 AP-2014]